MQCGTVKMFKTPRRQSLPAWLDDMIFRELGARYTRSCSNMTVIDWNKAQIENYLGTYFPRSYVEAFCLYSDYFSSNLPDYANKASLAVFDFGCGTGGEILGFLDAVDGRLPNIEKVTVRALDGNHHALRILERIIERRSRFLKPRCDIKTFAVTVDDIYDLRVVRSVINESFDFFMTFKAICEFATKRQFENGNPYASVIRSFSDTLAPGGRMLVADVSTKNESLGEWLPKAMDAGIAECDAVALVGNDGFNESFSVTHSRCANDISKIAWRILGLS